MTSQTIAASFYSLRAIPGQWRFVGPEGEVALRISGRFRSNSGNMLYAALLAGAGIGLVPTFVAGGDLAEGRLVSLMPDYRPIESELSAIYPPGKSPSAKVRSLIDFLANRFGPWVNYVPGRAKNSVEADGGFQRLSSRSALP